MRAAAALAALSGFLYFLSFPGAGLWPLGFVALVPLLIALEGRTPRQGMALGWITGVVMATAGFYWLLEMLRHYSGFPTPLCVLFLLILGAYQGGRMALTGWLFARAARNGWPSGPAFLLAFTAGEALYPLLFPWYYGAVLHDTPVLIQAADLAGPILVSVVLVAVNVAVAQGIRAWRERSRRRTQRALPWLIAPLLALAYGALVIRQIDARAATAPRLLVSMVQGNVPMELPDDAAYQRLHLQQVALSRRAVEQGAQLVLWSEGAYLYALPASTAGRSLAASMPGVLDVPHILGAIVTETEGDKEKAFNSALLVDKGGVQGRYDKQRLLPFGEMLPFGETFPVLYELSPESGHISPGHASAPLLLGDKRITVMICYEDVLPGLVNSAVAESNPHLLVNLTNDAWFGETWEPWMHHALARFRAVEHHRYFLRATNTGVSSIVDPVGRVLGHTGTFRPALLTGEVRMMQGGTVYETIGDAPWYLSSFAALWFAFRRRPGQAGAETG